MNVKEKIEYKFLISKAGALKLTRRSETLRRAGVRTDDGIGYIMGTNERTDQKLFKDGSIKVGEHLITINTGSIEKLISKDSGENPLKGLTMDQAIGAVAGHESGHTEKVNTKQRYENNSEGANRDLEARPDKIMNKILQELNEVKIIKPIELEKIKLN